MKVIKHGNIKDKITICHNCGCEFIYDKILDVKTKHGVWGNSSYVECPECANEIVLQTGYYTEL